MALHCWPGSDGERYSAQHAVPGVVDTHRKRHKATVSYRAVVVSTSAGMLGTSACRLLACSSCTAHVYATTATQSSAV
eukprot:20215-Heterococcus_DN1.PRE.2